MAERLAEARADSGAQTCPSCGKGVDPLRAGHVAILDGRFLYFCDEHCKRQLLHSTRSPAASEVVTAEPPPVRTAAPPLGSVAPSTHPPPAAAPVSAEREIGARDPEPTPSVPPESEVLPDEASDGPQSEPAPRTLRSPALPSVLRSASEPSRAAQRTILWISWAGAVCGVLAASVALAGPSASAFRLPFAALATLALTGRMALARRDPADTHPLAAVFPVLGALVAALWAATAFDLRAGAIASFAGLSAATVLVVELLLGKAREPLSLARAHISQELDTNVRVVREGLSVLVPATEVKSGEQVVVEAGEMLGVDALVAAGDAVVCPWLDSKIEIRRKDGDPVLAGARVVSGRLRLTTTWAGNERAWARLALSPALRADVAAPLTRGVRLAVERGVPLAALLGGIAAYAAEGVGPGMMATACAAAVAVGVRGVAAAVALHHAQGHLGALSHGIVYKDAGAFDMAGRTDVAVLCSRGTVLMGEPEIVALEALGPLGVERVLALAAGAEAQSTHPFASAILRAARARGERPENVRSVTAHRGLGVTALAASGERLVVGNRALLLQEKVSVALADGRVAELEAQGRSVLLIALAGRLVGLLALQDGLRAGARAAVQRLLDARLEPVLLSGEARDTCETIGRALDIEHIRPEVLPADRGAEVRALREGGHVVAVLGLPAAHDGALGAADVSVALGAAGATPGEWSAAVASDDVRDAARALSLAHETRDRAKVAAIMGFAPGVAAAVAIAFGVLPPVFGPLGALVGAIIALVHAKE